MCLPLLPQPKFRKPPKEREILPTPAKRKIPSEDAVLEDVENEDDERIRMQQKIDILTKELEQIQVEKFGLQRFSDSDSDIRFYTGFPDYNTLTSFYEFLGPAVTQLNYWGSDFSENRLSETEKRGHSRKLKPIDELFLVLYRLRCNVLEKDLGDRFGLHPSSVSRNITTWINFLYHTLTQLPIWASQVERCLLVLRHTTPRLVSSLIVQKYSYRCHLHFVHSHRHTLHTKATILPRALLT